MKHTANTLISSNKIALKDYLSDLKVMLEKSEAVLGTNREVCIAFGLFEVAKCSPNSLMVVCDAIDKDRYYYSCDHSPINDPEIDGYAEIDCDCTEYNDPDCSGNSYGVYAVAWDIKMIACRNEVTATQDELNQMGLAKGFCKFVETYIFDVDDYVDNMSPPYSEMCADIHSYYGSLLLTAQHPEIEFDLIRNTNEQTTA
jgi:hypothetical protein